jgi:hypothetical protein
LSDFGINRFEELNNYSGLMTRYKMVIQMRIKAYARAATIMDGTGSRRHQGPARRRIKPATFRPDDKTLPGRFAGQRLDTTQDGPIPDLIPVR